MSSANTTLLVISAVFVLVVVLVFAQSVVRQIQAKALFLEIQKSSGDTKVDPDKVISSFQVHKERIQYVAEHRPLLNLKFFSASASGELANWCGALAYLLSNKDRFSKDTDWNLVWRAFQAGGCEF